MNLKVKVLDADSIDPSVVTDINRLLGQLSKTFLKRSRSFNDLKVVAENKNNKILTVWYDDVMIAMALCMIVHTLSRKVLLLEELVVDSLQRRKGVGSFLLFKVMDIAHEQDVDAIEFLVNSSNVAAQRLYLKNHYIIRDQVAMNKILKRW